MTPTVIILMILGLAFIFGSFALFSKKDEEKDLVLANPEITTELTDEQKDEIEKNIRKFVEEKVSAALLDTETRLAQISNEKTLALGDYAVAVNEEIERNHNEVLFLYNMLNDKHNDLIETATAIDDFRKEIDAYIANMSYGEAVAPENTSEKELEEAIKNIDENILESTEQEEVEEVDANKDIILELHKTGLSILEIAKRLGLGVGEVKLVVDLYQGGSK